MKKLSESNSIPPLVRACVHEFRSSVINNNSSFYYALVAEEDLKVDGWEDDTDWAGVEAALKDAIKGQFRAYLLQVRQVLNGILF